MRSTLLRVIAAAAAFCCIAPASAAWQTLGRAEQMQRGDDALTLAMMSLGASGVISVISNLVPQWMKSLVSAAASGDFTAARTYHRKVQDFASNLVRFGPNPVPIKTAMAVCGLIQDEFRLPLCGVEVDARQAIGQLLRRHEIGGTTS